MKNTKGIKISMKNMFTGATLLSVEEAKQIPVDIRKLKGCWWWWLCSPGLRTDFAAIMGYGGVVGKVGFTVNTDYVSVRPALHLNFESSDTMSDGTKLRIGKYGFTIVCNGEYALCDTSIGKSVFRKDWKADDANIYEVSDVKKYIDNWFDENIKDKPLVKIITKNAKETETKEKKADALSNNISILDDLASFEMLEAL